MARKRYITKANWVPDSSRSAFWKKNTTVISSPVKSPVLRTVITIRASIKRIIEPPALHTKD
jgi:hypothetical protein